MELVNGKTYTAKVKDISVGGLIGLSLDEKVIFTYYDYKAYQQVGKDGSAWVGYTPENNLEVLGGVEEADTNSILPLHLPLDNKEEVHVSPLGSLRKNCGKTDISHLPPSFIKDLAEVFSKNSHKYPKWNYAKGQLYTTAYDSLMRHILAFMDGEDKDPEDGCSHIMKAAANILILYCSKEFHVENNPELDDRFRKVLGIKGR